MAQTNTCLAGNTHTHAHTLVTNALVTIAFHVSFTADAVIIGVSFISNCYFPADHPKCVPSKNGTNSPNKNALPGVGTRSKIAAL